MDLSGRNEPGLGIEGLRGLTERCYSITGIKYHLWTLTAINLVCMCVVYVPMDSSES